MIKQTFCEIRGARDFCQHRTQGVQSVVGSGCGRKIQSPSSQQWLGLSLAWGKAVLIWSQGSRFHSLGMFHSLGIIPNSGKVRWTFLLGFTELFRIFWWKTVSVDILSHKGYTSLFSLRGTKIYYSYLVCFTHYHYSWPYSLVVSLLLFMIWNTVKKEV